MYRLSRSWLIVGGAAIAALLLTITRPSPEGLMGLGVGNREVRAAPGQATSSANKHNLAALEVVNRTLIRVQESYVDPSRIDPKGMLYSALDSVQFNIPEVLVEADRDADKLTVHVNDKRQTFSTNDIDSPWRLSKTLKRVFRFIEANMNPGADLAEVEYAAANGILETLDPHSVLLDPEQAREMNVNTGGGFSGLGIVIGMRQKKLTVIRPMPDTPAARAGILAKDHIVKINDEVTENLTLTESVDRMRGKKGSKVSIWVERSGESDFLRFDLIRDRITVASVQSKLLSKKVGYIKIKQFSSPTAKETKAALRELTKQGAKSFVLDLRSNPGGLLQQAIRVSDLFLDRGTIVTTVGGQERENHRASRDKTVSRAPVAVLLNSNSASASEIVAGALKNLDRAVVIGDTSFGKGSVQILYDNEEDGTTLKLTIAQYLTPGDLSIQGLGITADIELRRVYVPKKNTSTKDYLRLLPPSKSYRERDLKASIVSEYAKSGSAAQASLSFVYERAKPSQATDEEAEPGQAPIDDDDEIVEDFEIRFARDYLASYGKATRKASLKHVDKALSAPRTAEGKRLHDKLQLLGIDWSDAPKGHPAGALQANFEVEGGHTSVDAGDTVEIKGTLTNTGTETIYRAHTRIRSADYAFDDTEMLFGKIAAGESKTWTAHIKIRNAAVDRLDYLKFDVTDAALTQVKAKPLRLQIHAAARPTFAYSHQILDQGNGDGLVQAGEQHKLRITVRNTGKGIAEDTVALLRNASGKDIKLEKARFDLESLEPGKSKTVDFVFTVAPKTHDNVIVVELQVYDATLGESVTEKLRYPLRPAAAGPKRARGSVRVTKSASVFEGAADTSAFIAKAAKGTVFRVTGTQGRWLRVDLGGGQPGFVLNEHTKKVNAAPKLGGVDARMQVTPPTLSLNVSKYETSAPTYSLKGTVFDDSKVEDVYIFVSNRESKIENRKVFYHSNRTGKKANELSFDAEIPLWPGSNAVTVVARENDGVRTVQVLYLNRTEARTAAAVAPTK